jgi:mono/diheme cytochrome c family protein
MRNTTAVRLASLGVAVGAVALLFQAGCQSETPAATAATAKASLPEKLSFNEHIQPILSENCYPCHGPDSGSRKAGLRLDHAEFAFAPHEKSGPAIVRGKPDESPLVQRIESKKEKEVMPPAEAHKTLRPEEIALLRRWVAEGAEYQPHWAFIAPVAKPPVPAVASAKEGQIRNPIDAFIIARLEKENLTPSPEADRRSLIRRVTLDLTGLLPTPDEVDAFLADTAPGAYERVVDRLLASPRFGEHRARYWLDYARLCHPGVQREQALRSFRARTARGRFAAGALARRTRGDGFCALQPHDQRRRHDSRGDLRQPDARSRGSVRRDLSRPDHRLRGLPRSQVRSFHAA